MPRRFRDSFAGTANSPVRPGIVEFFVEADDKDGHRSVWPESAPQLSWSVTVV
jgi:hypothetical protein